MNNTWWVGEEDLDSDQYDVIELPPDGRFLVTGPPGSGKTNLLLLRAKFLSLGGHPNIAVVVLTRSLRDFIAAGASTYGFSSEQVFTSQRFFREFLRERGAAFANQKDLDFETQRAMMVAAVKAEISANRVEKVYDAVLLDEAQDFLSDEIDIFDVLSERRFAVADARQRIYRTSDAISTLQQRSIVKKLRHHYRNGLQICRMADAIAKDNDSYEPLEGLSAYDESARPSSVEAFPVDTMDQQADLIVERLRVQMVAYPGEPIGILTPLRPDAEALYALISKTDIARHVMYGTDEQSLAGDEHPVILTTIHSAKGLEFRAVHIASTEGLKKFEASRNLMFTAVTRAKTALSIYHMGTLPGFVAGALAKIKPLPDLPAVRDLFRRDTK